MNVKVRIPRHQHALGGHRPHAAGSTVTDKAKRPARVFRGKPSSWSRGGGNFWHRVETCLANGDPADFLLVASVVGIVALIGAILAWSPV